MFYLDVREQGWVAQVGLPTGADVVPVVWLVSAPPPAPGRLVGMLETGWEHYILYPKQDSTNLYPLPKMPSHPPAPKRQRVTLSRDGGKRHDGVRRDAGGRYKKEGGMGGGLGGQWVQCKV